MFPFSGHLALEVEDAFELAIEIFDRHRTEFMKDPADLDPAIGMGIGAIARGD